MQVRLQAIDTTCGPSSDPASSSGQPGTAPQPTAASRALAFVNRALDRAKVTTANPQQPPLAQTSQPPDTAPDMTHPRDDSRVSGGSAQSAASVPGSGAQQRGSLAESPPHGSASMAEQQYHHSHAQPVDDSSSQGRQALPAVRLHSKDESSQGTGTTAEVHIRASQPSEEPVGRSQDLNRSGPEPQQEISLRDLASGGSASPPETAVGELGQSFATSHSIGVAEQAGNGVPLPTQISFNPQQQQQQKLRQQQSGNPFQAAANASSPSGDEILPSVHTGIALTSSRAQASPDNPSAPPADDPRPTTGDGNIPNRALNPAGVASSSQPGTEAVPIQQSGSVGLPEWQQEPGSRVQSDQAGYQEVANMPEPGQQARHGSPTPVAGSSSSMHTATSIAQLLADLPPAGMSLCAVTAMQAQLFCFFFLLIISCFHN